MRYSICLINSNGYTIKKEFDSVEKAKQFAKHYPLSVFFGWIYDKQKDEMVCQNIYSNRWKKCNNETFVRYF